MPELSFGQAVDRAVEDGMVRDETIVLIGEDVSMLRAPLFARFGAARVLAAPISEAAFVGAAAGAAMAGLRPVVELYMVDFVAVALDAVLNHIAKLEAGLLPRFGRVCVEDTLPYARHLERAALPNADRIVTAAKELVNE